MIMHAELSSLGTRIKSFVFVEPCVNVVVIVVICRAIDEPLHAGKEEKST